MFNFSKVGVVYSIAMAVCCLAHVTHADAQEEVKWQPLGPFGFVDITGRPDTVVKFARALAPALGTYVFRTDYRNDRAGVDGRPWRSSYITATIDCSQKSMRLLRTDYYTSSGTFVDGRGSDITLTTEMISASEELVAYYNFACGLPKSPPR